MIRRDNSQCCQHIQLRAAALVCIRRDGQWCASEPAERVRDTVIRCGLYREPPPAVSLAHGRLLHCSRPGGWVVLLIRLRLRLTVAKRVPQQGNWIVS